MNIPTPQLLARPPALAQKLVCFVAGPAYEEEIAGDLCEQFEERHETETRRTLWYWQQVLSSLPALVKMRLQNMTRREMFFEIAFATFTLLMIWSWELNIAQKASWPIASQIIGYTQWSAMTTCKAMYICLYVLAVLLIFMGVSIWRRLTGKTHHFVQLHCALLSIIATTPMIFYLTRPNSLGDGSSFRLAQIAAVWGLLLVCLVVGRKRLRLH